MEADLPDRVSCRYLKELSDTRGGLTKILMRHELPDPRVFGEIYFTYAVANNIRGEHYHKKTTEWFHVTQGTFRMWLQDLSLHDGAVYKMDFSSDSPVVVSVPPMVAHAFENIGEEKAVLMAYSDRPYNKNDTDTFAWKVVK